MALAVSVLNFVGMLSRSLPFFVLKTAKCRCGPVENPEFPDNAMKSSRFHFLAENDFCAGLLQVRVIGNAAIGVTDQNIVRHVSNFRSVRLCPNRL